MSDDKPEGEEEDFELKAYDASDPKQVARRKSAEGRRKKADDDVLRAIMKTSNGRAWLWRLLTACHIFEPSIVFGQPDASAFREGERNVGNLLLQQVQRASPELWLSAIKENNDAGY